MYPSNFRDARNDGQQLILGSEEGYGALLRCCDDLTATEFDQRFLFQTLPKIKCVFSRFSFHCNFNQSSKWHWGIADCTKRSSAQTARVASPRRSTSIGV
jgi:hypothetical protein